MGRLPLSRTISSLALSTYFPLVFASSCQPSVDDLWPLLPVSSSLCLSLSLPFATCLHQFSRRTRSLPDPARSANRTIWCRLARDGSDLLHVRPMPESIPCSSPSPAQKRSLSCCPIPPSNRLVPRCAKSNRSESASSSSIRLGSSLAPIHPAAKKSRRAMVKPVASARPSPKASIPRCPVRRTVPVSPASAERRMRGSGRAARDRCHRTNDFDAF